MIATLLNQNNDWAQEVQSRSNTFFDELSKGQSPEVVWIGCSDSRVPPNTITGTEPGDLFVHRNIANLVLEDDLSLISVLEYAVKVLKVKHIVICGHYGCGGVQGALNGTRIGEIDAWLDQIKLGLDQHSSELNEINDDNEKLIRAVELHALNQKSKLSQLNLVKEALSNNQDLEIHALIFDLSSGKLHEVK